MNSPAGSRVALLCVAVILLWCHSSRGIAASTDCIGKGGETVCGSPVFTPWSYRFVDTSCSTYISYLRTICEVWYLGNYDTNCYASPITEANMTGRAYNWAKRSLCVVETHIAQPWLAPGQTLDTGSCAHGVVRPKYTNGVETLNYRSITSSGSSGRSCDQPRGVRSVISRSRSATVNCPPGSTKRTLNGVVECTQPQEEMSCPSGDEGKPSCETDNPISLGLGNKRQTETDYAAAGASPLKFTRIYNSRSYFHAPDYPEALPSALGEQWGSNYDRQLYAINSANTMAIVVRPGRIIKHFGPDGREIASPTRSRERLEKILNGSELSGWRYFTAEDATEIYDASGKLLSITDRRGIAQTFSYSDASTPVEVAPSAGLLIRVQDSFGRALAFAYNSGNRLISLTDPAGNLYTYEYDAIGNLEFVNLPVDSGIAVRRQYHYEHPSFKRALTGITDEHGIRYATYAYDAQGRANSSEHAGGADTTTLTFGVNGTTLTNALGGTRTYQFANVAGVLRNISITRPCSDCAGNATSSTTYDASGFVSSRTDFNGHVTNYVHDARGLETSRAEAVGTPQARTITTTWHPTFRLPLEVNEPGRRTEYTYDANGNRLTQTVTDTNTSESRTTTYTYAAQGLISSIDGARSDVADVTTLAYDSQGNLTSITNALNQVTQITSHDAHGNPLTIVDPNGVITTLTYDLRQRLLSRTVAGATTGFDYDDVGNLEKLTLPTGTFLSYSYDAAHRLTDIQDNLGNKIHYTLDDAGNRTAEKVYDPSNSLKRQLNQEYDNQSRLKKILGANGQVTQLGYDAQGNRTSSTEAGSFVTGSQYDALDRIFKVTDAASGETIYTYNALDQLISVTDPKGLVTTYAVNAFGEVTQQTSPDTAITSYTYDKAGNRKSQIDSRSITVNYSYDALNRIAQADYPGTVEDVTYLYDGSNYTASIANGVGRLTGLVDESGQVTHSYDARGNLIQEERLVNGGGFFSTGYAYDTADRLTQITYPTGRVVNHTLDALGRVTRITTTANGQTTMVAENIAYLPFGTVASYTLGNGVAVQKSFDLDYRLSEDLSQGTAVVQHRRYYYDPRNNIDAIEDALNASRSQSFGYDALSRLTSAQGAYGLLNYTYDPVGNRTQETRDGVSSNYDYPATSHRLSAITGANPASFTYDAVGNVTQKGDLQLSYNAANRASQMTKGTQTVGAVYNAMGQRIRKVVAGNETIFHYDPQGHLLAETSPTSPTQREYLWLGDMPLALESVMLRPEAVVDDGDSGYTAASSWLPNTTGYGGDSQVHPATTAVSVIRDDPTGTQYGLWLPNVNAAAQGGGYHATILAGDNRFTWNVPLPAPGTYQVEVRWITTSQPCTACRYAVTHLGGVTNNTVSQASNSGQWVSLGSYVFGSTAVIRLTNSGNTTMAADAVRLTRVTAPSTGNAQWKAPEAAQYQIQVRYPANPGYSTSAQYTVQHGGGNTTIPVNQQVNGDTWNTLGTFTFTDPNSQGVTLTPDALNAVAADAVRFVPAGSSITMQAASYFHTDHLNTPQRLTGPNQQIVWDTTPEPFGKTTPVISTVSNPLRAPGQYADQETGLYDNWWRSYDPSLGRYPQSDRIGLWGGLNTYAYVGSNPLIYIDPLGLDACPYPIQDDSIESICPECFFLGGSRLLYAGLAKAIPSLAPAVEGSALGQAAYANAARNSLKDLFRGPVAPLLQGVRQPTLAESIGKYGLDSTKIIDAAAKTNAATNAAGAAGLGIGVLDAAAGANTGCGCEK